MRSKETNKVEEINLRQSFFQGSKILGTFLGMSVLYTLWIHATFQSWWVYFQIAARSSWAEWIVWFGLMVSIALMIGFMHFYLSKEKLKFSDYMNQHVNRITSLLIILFILGTIGIHSSHSPSVEIFVDNEKLNVNDTRSQSEGYYESILRADISSKLWDDDIDLALIKRKETLVNFIEGLYDKLKPNADEDQSVGIHETSNIYQSDPYIYKRFKANFNGRYRRKSLITNDLGLRDTTYTKVRTKPTVRVALIGSSPDMGYGVEGNEMYEYLAEKEVNEYAQVDSLELINFSFVDQGLLTQVYNLEALVLDYKPDYCIFVEHYLESDKENDRLDKMLRHGGKIYPALREELDRIHITDDKIKTRQLNDEYYDHLCIWAYHRIATLCREHHIKPVLMYLPAPGVNNRYDAHVSSFTNEGFQIINLNDIFEKYKPDELILSPKDHHPNAQGHWIIKDRVKRELIKLLNMH